jgi:hypothetical protein
MEVCQESQHDFSFLCMIFVYLTLLFLGLSLLLTSQVMDRAINQQALSPLNYGLSSFAFFTYCGITDGSSVL